MKFLLLLFTLLAAPAYAETVMFVFPPGLHGSNWNTEEAPLVVKRGDVLAIKNDDDWTHQLHTFGYPCSHGGPIYPGEVDDHCLIHPASELGAYHLYDHRTLSSFYIMVTE